MHKIAKVSRRHLLAAGGAALASPALAQVSGAFDGLTTTPEGSRLDKVWDPEKGIFISLRDLIDRLIDTEIILIGERHGFAPHQDRAAFLIQALADRGRYPALALEMLEPAQEPVIEAYRRKNPEYARRLGIDLDWINSGWPDWQFYEPIFDAAFSAKLDIIGADMPLSEQRRIEAEGTPDRPDDPSILLSWQDSMFKAHCGLINSERTRRLALKQWKRDQAMASAIQGHQNGAILIAGQEHVRADRGVPRYLEGQATQIAFVAEPSEGKGWLSWITEAAEAPERPC